MRLVGLRLDKIERALELEQIDIADKEASTLCRQIADLPRNSVVIIEAATALHPLDDDNYWIHLGTDKLEFLRNEINPLFRTIAQADFKAMRFEKDVLETSLALMGSESGDKEDQQRFDTLKEGIIAQIGELPLSIPMVARHKDLINAAQQTAYWLQCTDADLDDLTARLAPLMKFREGRRSGDGQVKLDLSDVLHNKERVEFGPQHEAVSVTRYREMVEATVLELTRGNPILQRIRDGHDISEFEAEKLAALLNRQHPHITEELLRSVYRNRKASFIQFIRHILGIETLASFPDTVGRSFDQFIAEHSNLNSRQLEFLRLLKAFIIEREQVEKRDLIQSPFTIIHPQGIRGVFSPTEINAILELTERLAA